jgi:putative membrane protein
MEQRSFQKDTVLAPLVAKNDRKFSMLIILLSCIIFIAIVILGRVKLDVQLGFDAHIFARINAVINSTVSVLLVAGLFAVKSRRYVAHRNLMLSAMILSALFLISYIGHHLFAGETSFGGQGTIRYVYFFVLITHIFLAAIILPFILFTTYRALIAEWPQHRKLARVTWPIWLYVSISGVAVYLLISPYYN